MVQAPEAWPWSSYRAHTGQADAPAWLASQELWGYLLGRDASSAADEALAQRLYASLVDAGRGQALWDEALNRQIYLGDDGFVGRMLDAAQPAGRRSTPVPKVQRSAVRTLAQWLADGHSREEALLRAHRESGLTMTAIAKELGLTIGRVSQLIARAERAANGAKR
jgi:hypothetical protein